MDARYLDPKYSRWISVDPALGEYVPQAPVNDDAKKHNQNLPGMGGVFNSVNLSLFHYAGNNPVRYIDPTGMMEEENENINNKISDANFLVTLFSAIYKEIGKNKPTVEPVLSEAFNDLGVPKDVIVGFKISSQDAKLLTKAKNLSTVSKCLLAASILLDFVDAANVGENKGDSAQTKRLARNLITTYAVYKATEAGTFVGKNVCGWVGEAIGSMLSPGAGTVVGKVTGSILGGVGGGFLAGWFVQTNLDEFFEKRGW